LFSQTLKETKSPEMMCEKMWGLRFSSQPRLQMIRWLLEIIANLSGRQSYVSLALSRRATSLSVSKLHHRLGGERISHSAHCTLLVGNVDMRLFCLLTSTGCICVPTYTRPGHTPLGAICTYRCVYCDCLRFRVV